MKKAAIILIIIGAGLCLVATASASGKIKKIDKDKTAITVQPMTQEQPVTPDNPEVTPTADAPNAGEEINWQVISGGGGSSSAGGFKLSGTLGQLAAGTSTAGAYDLNHGFWQNFDLSDCDCVPGDPNNDHTIDVGDAVFVINFIWREGPFPIPYPVCSGDTQADCFVNVGDAVFIINFIWREGPYPVSCEEWRDACGAYTGK
jgi:hypothetical protein